MKNTDISKLLGEEWKKLPPHVRQPHIDKEAREREEYHQKTSAWREQRRNEEAVERLKQAAVTEAFVESAKKETPLLGSVQSRSYQCKVPAENSPNMAKEASKLQPLLFRTGQSSIQGTGQMKPLSTWESEVHLGYNGVEESLIPTILPAAHPPQALLPSPFGTIN
eukprot:CAMPEP_0178747804 /NCGR_PEP_ID=MMETSP0744-20121128/8535_1 /TAXON_ID=913974 /ORGANISM="Nitzschia punctata, Strain CCMP561" /LENGTH=165 /DNA_ID=CAMNT_0020401101 /DNA_START=170 /DNA_END=664 /DNA_ORIENTATION=+